MVVYEDSVSGKKNNHLFQIVKDSNRGMYGSLRKTLSE